MMVNLNLQLSINASSRAEFELEEELWDNLDYYHEKNFTHVPLPFDGKYYDIETEEFHELEDEQWIPEDVSIVNMINHLREYPFLLIHVKGVYYEKDGDVDLLSQLTAPDDAEVLGNALKAVNKAPAHRDKIVDRCRMTKTFRIITLADINRREVREGIYPLIAELESRLASEIKESEIQPEEMYRDLSPRTVGRWEKSKLNDVEMHISEQMPLSEIVKIVAKSESLRSEFDYGSRNQFDNDVGGLIELRNKVMHITRPLIHNQEDLDTLCERIGRCITVIEQHGGSVVTGNYEWYGFGRRTSLSERVE